MNRYIYLRRNRHGEIIEAELVDEHTIEPLLDGDGRRPLPPLPAYRQVAFGKEVGRYTSDELVPLERESASRVEMA